MSQEAVERVLGRLITDDRFRFQAARSFQVACRQEGYLLTPTELQLLAGLKLKGMAQFATEVNPGLRRADTCGEPTDTTSHQSENIAILLPVNGGGS